VAAASWIALIVVGLLTALLLGWVLLGIAFLRSGPAPEGQPVPFLACVFGGHERLGRGHFSLHRVLAKRRYRIAGMLTLISLVEVTWALSSPYHALYSHGKWLGMVPAFARQSFR
jgi:hypothetical protein